VTVLPQLERDLLEAAREQLAVEATLRRELDRADRGRADGVPHVPRRHLGGVLATVLSLAVVVAIAAVGLTALKHGAGSRTAARPTVADARAELIRSLGVLRRSQTSAERHISVPLSLGGSQAALGHRATSNSARPLLSSYGDPTVDKSRVRRVEIPDGSLAIIPLTYRPSIQSGRRVEAVSLVLHVAGSPIEVLSPASVGTVRSEGLNVFTYAHGRNRGALLVPDGVAAVTLGRFQVRSPVNVSRPALPLIRAGVHNNVAAFALNALIVASRDGSVGTNAPRTSSTGAYAQMTWVGPNGNVLKRSEILLAFSFTVVGAREASLGG
jgi:hypothetical protein